MGKSQPCESRTHKSLEVSSQKVHGSPVDPVRATFNFVIVVAVIEKHCSENRDRTACSREKRASKGLLMTEEPAEMQVFILYLTNRLKFNH